MEYTILEKINEYESKTINPISMSDTMFEMYSVPAFDKGYPEYLRGNEIASAKMSVQKGDILLCKINPRINRVWIVSDESKYQNIASTEWIVVRSNQYNHDFLAWYFRSPRFQQLMTSEVTGIGGSLTRAQPKRVKKYPVPVLERTEQDDIVQVLNSISKIISSKNKEISKFNELIKARFVEMFGDMFTNEGRWEQVHLSDVADIVSGITKGRKVKETDLIEVPYMAVSNVKDGYIDWSTIKTISVTASELEQYRLLPYDVLMTEGGDPDKLGRGAVIQRPIKNCIHQNHIFRVRLKDDIILPEFFTEYLQHQKAKRYFWSCAKQTTGIASINMGQLRALPLLCPPLSFQTKFVAFVHQVDKSKAVVQKSLDEMQLLFDSLMQQYFG